MSNVVGTATVTIRADTTQLRADLDKQIKPALDKAGKANPIKPDIDLKPFSKRLDEASVKLRDFGAKATKSLSIPIGLALAAAATAGVQAASSLNEAQNKVNVVFGDSAKLVRDFGETAAKAVGQSERAALQAAGTYGNLFRALGLAESQSADLSVSLVKLTADLSSFNDASPDEVFLALRAGLVGETEPLRRFGVNLNQARIEQEALNLGLTQSGEVLSGAAKAQAAYSLIIKDTSLAQGDFARTSEGLANQTRTTKAQFEEAAAALGTQFLPIAAKGAEVLGTLAGAFAGLDPAVQNVALAAAVALAALGPVLTVLGNVTKVAKATRDAVIALRLALIAGSPAVLAAGLLAVGAAAAGVTVFFRGLARASKEADDRLSDLLDGIDVAKTEGMAEALARIDVRLNELDTSFGVSGGILDRFGADNVAGLVQLLTPMRDTIAENRAEVGALGDAAAALNADLIHTEENLAGISNQFGISRSAAETLAAKLGVDLTGSFTAVQRKVGEAAKAIETAESPAGRLGTAIKAIGDEAGTASTQLDGFNNALELTLFPFIAANRASDDFQKGIKATVEDLPNIIAGGAPAIAEAAAALAEKAVKEVNTAVVAGRLAAEDATEATRQRLQQLRDQIPGLAAGFDPLLAQLDILDRGATIEVTANTSQAESAIAALRRNLDLLRRSTGINVPIPKAQHGGIMAGGMVTVGEAGPETVFLPPGSHVRPSTVTNNFTATINTRADQAPSLVALLESRYGWGR